MVEMEFFVETAVGDASSIFLPKLELEIDDDAGLE